MNKPLFLSILLIFCSSCDEQNNHDKKQKKEIVSQSVYPIGNTNNIIGFGCFEGGSETRTVMMFSDFLDKRDHANIRNRLTHKNPAEKYLATLVCIKLQEKKLIELTKKEWKQIMNNKRSSELVSLCSGCTNWEERTIRELFKRDQNFLYDRAEIWLDETVK